VPDLAALFDAANRSCLYCMFRCVPRAQIPSSIVFALCIDQTSNILISTKSTLFDLNDAHFLNFSQLLGARTEESTIVVRVAKDRSCCVPWCSKFSFLSVLSAIMS
jgi:hypothetical protein